MTDEKHKRRPWFQLHLSTAIAVMIVGAVLIGLNACLRIQLPDNPEKETFEFYGWPFPFKGRPIDDPDYAKRSILKWYDMGPGGYGFLLDAFISITILALTAFAFEYWMRRRDRQRRSEPPRG